MIGACKGTSLNAQIFLESIDIFLYYVIYLDSTTGMQSSDTASGVRVNCFYHIFSQKWNARNKETSFAF